MFVRARDEANAAPLVSLTRTSGLFYRGALFVPETCPVPRLEELRGKRVAWVVKQSRIDAMNGSSRPVQPAGTATDVAESPELPIRGLRPLR